MDPKARKGNGCVNVCGKEEEGKLDKAGEGGSRRKKNMMAFARAAKSKTGQYIQRSDSIRERLR